MSKPLTPQEIALEVLTSEPFAWLMVGANHTESHLDQLRPAWAAFLAAGGRSYFQGGTDAMEGEA